MKKGKVGKAVATKSLLLPILLPGGEDCARCTEELRERVLSISGVRAAEVDAVSHQLVVSYDGTTDLSDEIETQARIAGAEIARSMRHQSLLLRGVDCPDCALRVERVVAAIPGVESASVSLATSSLLVEYHAGKTSLEEIARALESLGYGLASPAVSVVRKSTLRVAGMHCSDCSRTLERVVRRIEGVQTARVSLSDGRIDVEYDASRVSLHQIAAAVSETGYTVIASDDSPAIGETMPFWQGWRRLALTALSGLILAAAFATRLGGAASEWHDALAATAILVGSPYIVRNALLALRTRLTTDINFLVVVAVTGAIAIGEWSEAASVVFLFSVAELLESYTIDRTRNAIRKLMQVAPDQATVRRNGKEVTLPVREIAPGELMVVRPGERIATDGKITSGASWVNEAPVTGEPMPVEKGVGDSVFGGSINGSGALEVRVTRPYEDTTLARVLQLVEEAQAQRAHSEQFVDRFARVYTPAVIALAAIVATVPTIVFSAPFDEWFYRSLALLIIACPCALVISTPVTIVAAIAAAARNGVLVKGGIYLEEIGRVRAIAFDKTGTLTRGTPEILEIMAFDGVSRREVLALAAAVESRSEHVLAQAVLRRAWKDAVSVPPVTEFQAIAGLGAKAVVHGITYFVGRPALFAARGISMEPVEAVVAQVEAAGQTVLLLGTSDRLIGLLVAADRPRLAARNTIRALKDLGIRRTVMLTGDNGGTAATLARELGIDEYHAELLPQQKVEAVHALIARHGRVAMVGDGINDAPALAAATVGIAMGTAGTDVALETADITLMADDLSRIPFTVRLGRQALRTIRENIAFALVVKALFVVATFTGQVTLWLAVAADMGTSLIVTANGMRLLRATRTPDTPQYHVHAGSLEPTASSEPRGTGQPTCSSCCESVTAPLAPQEQD